MPAPVGGVLQVAMLIALMCTSTVPAVVPVVTCQPVVKVMLYAPTASQYVPPARAPFWPVRLMAPPPSGLVRGPGSPKESSLLTPLPLSSSLAIMFPFESYRPISVSLTPLVESVHRSTYPPVPAPAVTAGSVTRNHWISPALLMVVDESVGVQEMLPRLVKVAGGAPTYRPALAVPLRDWASVTVTGSVSCPPPWALGMVYWKL